MFCPKCGLELSTSVPEGEDRPRSTCRSCGYVHYENPSVLVSCILFQEVRLLWIKRATEPYSGRWAFPGGFVERGETVEEATCRELYEETGLILKPDLLILNGVSSVPEMNQIYLSLIAPLPSMNFRATRECTEVKLAKETDIPKEEYAYPPIVESWLHVLYERVRQGQVGKGPAIMRSYRSRQVSP